LEKVAFLGESRADYHMLLARSGTPESVGVQALGELVKRLRNQVSFINFGNVPECSWTGRVLALLQQTRGMGLYRFTTSETYAVSLPKTLDEYLGQLGERSRRHFRYDRRRLSKEFSVRYEVYQKAEDRCLAAIEEVDKARWADGSRFWRTSLARRERATMQALSELGAFRAIVLHLDGRPSAFIYGAILDDRWLIDRIGHDPTIAPKLSVGKVANFQAVEYAIQQGIRQFDLTRGGESYKQWLGATAHTNLHLRIYRSPVDRWLDRTMAQVLTSIRHNPLLLRTYLKLRKGTTGD
jgi:CelD/BcsL family acetyltransferase involved in cellulose biosynthesis